MTLPTNHTTAAGKYQSVPSVPSTSSAARATFLLAGGATMLLQILVLRESFVLFAGNELSLAIQLGLWLILTALGGIIGRSLPPRSVSLLFALLGVASIYSILTLRIAPLLIDLPLGKEITLTVAVPILAAALAPLNIIAGAIFPTGCAFFANKQQHNAIGRLYMYEALGAAVAGISFTLLLAGNIQGVNLAAIIASIVLITWALIFCRRAFIVTVPLIAAIWMACDFNPASRVDSYWWQKRHAGSKHIATFESPYQRLDIAEMSSQFTVYSNGSPAFVIKTDHDIPVGYKKADFYLSLHDDPKRILIIGTGQPGLIERTLQYPIDSLYYITLETALIDIAKIINKNEEGYNAVNTDNYADKRLTILTIDPRDFLNTTSQQFDIAILDLPLPSTACQNRFFTHQAFTAIKQRLSPTGILAFELPSLPHYISSETAMLLGSINYALKKAFNHTNKNKNTNILIAETMLFIASKTPTVPTLDILAKRFANRPIDLIISQNKTIHHQAKKQSIFKALYAPFFNNFRKQQHLDRLNQTAVPPNSDQQPIAYYLNLMRYLRQLGLSHNTTHTFTTTLSRTASVFNTMPRSSLIAVGFICFCIFTILTTQKKYITTKTTIAAAILTSGSAGMIGQLVIVFIYQNTFGQMYRDIGALFGTYMLGLVFGCALATNREKTPTTAMRHITIARLAMIAICLTIPTITTINSQLIFFAAMFFYAFVLGYEYPIANAIYKQGLPVTSAAGTLHAMDHLGAGLATLLAGTIILPFIGPNNTLIAIAFIHILILPTLITATLHSTRHIATHCHSHPRRNP